MWSAIKLLNLTRFPAEPTEDEVGRTEQEYMHNAEDLINFARCPARWAQGHREPNAKGYRLTNVIAELLLTLDPQSREIIREPDTYKARVLVCPVCDSESNARHCTKCDSDRKPKEVEKAWARTAKPCMAWAEDVAKSRRTAVRAKDYVLAEGAAQAALADPDIASLLAGASRNLTAVGKYQPTPEHPGLWVAQRLDILPQEGHSMDCALGLVYATVDAAPNRHSNMAHFRYMHMEAALALDMANAAEKGVFREVLQVIVEAEPPHVIARRRLAPEFLQEGRRLLYETLDALCSARTADKWATFDPSAPGTLGGWTVLHHDPALGEGADQNDARFGVANALN
jgi:hypothetical protein